MDGRNCIVSEAETILVGYDNALFDGVVLLLCRVHWRNKW